jgi:dynein heavy chain
MKIGDSIIPYNKDFKLFLSTTIPNPHYPPETFVKVTIINFGITLNGLEEQMMTLLINNEMPDLEQRKNAILIEVK